MLLLALVAVPVVFGLVMFVLGKRRITPVEVLIQIGVVACLIVSGYYITRWSGVRDTEIWSGRIASKDSEGTGCCHSYKCNCRQECSTDSKTKHTTCKEVCSTCYEHSGDTRYTATSTNGEVVFSDGCNAPGSIPGYWSAIRVGETTAWEHRFTNYVKADPDELIRRDPSLQRFAAALPAYPKVDGFKVPRVVVVGLTGIERWKIEKPLAELNADLGATKQVNVIIVLVSEADAAYADALAARWLGGKKNDVVLVIGAPSFPAIAWARVIAWNKASGGENEFKGALQHRVESLGTFDGDGVVAVLRDEITRGYERRPFSDFEYLMARAQPPGWAVILLFLLGLLVSGVLQWIFWRNRHWMPGRAPHERIRAWWDRRHAAPDAALPGTERPPVLDALVPPIADPPVTQAKPPRARRPRRSERGAAAAGGFAAFDRKARQIEQAAKQKSEDAGPGTNDDPG